MAINKPTIASGPVTTRQEAKTVVLTVSNAEPPGIRKYRTEDGFTVREAQEPEREGQMIVYRPDSTKLATLYVVVTIDGVLTWVQAQTRSRPYSSMTGEPWDPLAVQYSILAS